MSLYMVIIILLPMLSYNIFKEATLHYILLQFPVFSFLSTSILQKIPILHYHQLLQPNLKVCLREVAEYSKYIKVQQNLMSLVKLISFKAFRKVKYIYQNDSKGRSQSFSFWVNFLLQLIIITYHNFTFIFSRNMKA